jgi:hypothetical protein
MNKAKAYIVTRKDQLPNEKPVDALLSHKPYVGEVWRGVLCTALDVEEKRPTFFDWLFRRHKQWIVTATFEPIESSHANHNHNESQQS